MYTPHGRHAHRIYAHLRGRLASGEFAIGARLPSHAQLALYYGAAVLTVRRALDALEKEGAISRQQGRGTFVLSAPAGASDGADVTDRLRFHDRLQFQANLLDAVGQAIVATTPQGEITYWNRGAETLFGYSDREVMGRNVLEVLPPTRSLMESGQALDSLAAGEVRIKENMIERRDGGLVPVLTHTTPIRDQSGAVIGIIGVSTDISDQKSTQRDLLASEQRFRAIFDQAGVGVAQSDLDGHWLLVNDRLIEFYGYTREELFGRRFQDITHPDDLAADLYHFERMLRGEIAAYCLEKRFIRRDGSVTRAEVTVTLIRDGEGKPLYTLAVVADIEARKRGEDTIRRSEQHLRGIFDSMHIGIVVRGSDAEIQVSNPAARDLLGVTEEQLASLPPANRHRDMIDEQGSPFPADAYPAARAFQTGQPVRNIIMGIDWPAPADRTWLLVDAEPHVSDEGRVEQVVTTIVDITQRRQAEQDLIASEERYRSLVETSPDGIAVTGTDGVIRLANTSLATMLGYESSDSLVGTSVMDYFPDGDRRRADITLAQRAGGNHTTSIDVEYRAQRRDGSTFPVGVSSFVLSPEAGEPLLVTTTVRDMTERVAHEAQLRHLALHDPLTGLANRALLDDRLQQSLSVARRTGESVAVLMLDVDGFKEINDLYGHQVGDQVIRDASTRLARSLRESDTLARLGGDEFVIVLPGADRAGALRAATKLNQALELSFDLGDRQLHMAASIGIALYPEHTEDIDTLLRLADVAMYTAKETNNDNAVYMADADTHGRTRLALSSELRSAIDSDQLVLYYQPKIRLISGEIDGMEALVRWNHPERGLITPDQFIPLAEHSGAIRPLTTWVLTNALRQWQTWHDSGIDVGIAVNLSVRSLHDPDLPGIIRGLLEETAAPPSVLTIEITESVIMADPDRAMEMLKQLTDAGIRLSIDDFGTGYSSLAYLRHLRVNELKIDKSFVVDLDTNEENGFIVRSVVELGHNLGLKVVAEGVESQATLDILALLTCDRAQGYYLSRPLPAAEITAWIASWRADRMSRSGEHRPTVVVIDNEESVVAALQGLLTMSGYSVTSFHDPARLTLVPTEDGPDLFLIDLMLPGTTGIEVAEQLRAAGFHDTPMIAMSISGEMLSLAEASGLFRDTLTKPLDLQEILTVVARHCWARGTNLAESLA